MIGNDIVDLAASRKESDWQRKGWMEKLFTAREQTLIRAAERQETWAWLLWSMKEAAYKVYNRNSGRRFYAPLWFRCGDIRAHEGQVFGQVRFGSALVRTQSYLSDELVHTVAVSPRDYRAINVYIGSSDGPGAHGDRPPMLRDARGLPYKVDVDSGKAEPVSYSHHGRFEAIAFYEKLPPLEGRD